MQKATDCPGQIVVFLMRKREETPLMNTKPWPISGYFLKNNSSY